MTKAFDNHLILSKFTTEDLVTELAKRDGVEQASPDQYRSDTTLRGIGWNSTGVTILVVRRKPNL